MSLAGAQILMKIRMFVVCHVFILIVQYLFMIFPICSPPDELCRGTNPDENVYVYSVSRFPLILIVLFLDVPPFILILS